jgi:hypothetical protein
MKIMRYASNIQATNLVRPIKLARTTRDLSSATSGSSMATASLLNSMGMHGPLRKKAEPFLTLPLTVMSFSLFLQSSPSDINPARNHSVKKRQRVLL